MVAAHVRYSNNTVLFGVLTARVQFTDHILHFVTEHFVTSVVFNVDSQQRQKMIEEIAYAISFVCFVAGAIGFGYKTLQTIRITIAESKKLLKEHKKKLEALQKKHAETMGMNELLVMARTAMFFPIVKRTVGTDCEDLTEESADLEAGNLKDFSTSGTQTEKDSSSLPPIRGSTCSFSNTYKHVIIPVTD